MEAIAGTKACKHRSLGKQFGRRSRNKQFLRIKRVDGVAGFRRVELDTEVGVVELRTLDYLLYAISQRRARLRRRGRNDCEDSNGDQIGTKSKLSPIRNVSPSLSLESAIEVRHRRHSSGVVNFGLYASRAFCELVSNDSADCFIRDYIFRVNYKRTI